MVLESTEKAPRPGLSLYANLLDAKASAPGTISRAPVVFKQHGGGTDRHEDDVSASGQQTSLAELEDVASHDCYPSEKRQRGGRKKRKKNKESSTVQHWNDIYDPSRPNAYEEYQNSDEKMLEIKEWKDRLYAHRKGEIHESSINSGRRDGSSAQLKRPAESTVHPGRFFAPPINFEDDPRATGVILNDATNVDAQAWRSNVFRTETWPTQAVSLNSAERAPSSGITPSQHTTIKTTDPCSHKLQFIRPEISKASVRYNLPPPPPELSNTEAEIADVLSEETLGPNDGKAPRSLRPGQKGFAERLMSRYGWTEGSGLGAGGTGIINPLRVQVEKQKKKPDAEGEAEMERVEDGGLMQEIGDECGEKYGRVERVFIDGSASSDTPVFVKFTSQLSALRAVNALEGRIFNGNAITARFYDLEKFDNGIYD
ncbi:MAG: hypothetical protein LQ345_005772 [Seirophora villosa]|nr:MAG: hypothetical protein LQ345_005772 [Seirophora villosa]